MKSQDEAIQERRAERIVFLDEIDKIASRSETAARKCRGPACSATCCVVEGTTIIRNTHDQDRLHPVYREWRVSICQPSDLIPELQGVSRFVWSGFAPVEDFESILTRPTRPREQYTALLATEDVQLEFSSRGFAEWLRSWGVSVMRNENIGARRFIRDRKVCREVSFAAAINGQP